MDEYHRPTVSDAVDWCQLLHIDLPNHNVLVLSLAVIHVLTTYVEVGTV